jgi:hypothetical protein
MKQKRSKIQRWAAVLESDIGAPIRTHAEASVLATLLDTQTKLNGGYLQESANLTSDVAVYQQYALPLIRRQFPELLAMNTVAVIPTTTPNGIFFALRYLYDNTTKTGSFRNGQKKELGYDFDGTFTGIQNGFVAPYATADGELLDNYMPNGAGLSLFKRNGNSLTTGGSNIKTASIKVIKGSVIVGTRAIKSQYTLELQQDLASVHGQDVEALLLEALQFEIQQEIDREILESQLFVAQIPQLGGEKVIEVNLTSSKITVDGVDVAPVSDTIKGRWVGEAIAGAIINTILAVANKISVVSRMGTGNFAICSPDVVAMLSTLQGGMYNPSIATTNTAVAQSYAGGIAEAGSILSGQVKVYRDIYADQSYALVGYKGPRQGESGIIFMPYIPYIFCKTAGQEDGSPRLIVKSRYAVVANLLGAGQFYRVVRFHGVTGLIIGLDSDKDTYTWDKTGGTYDPKSYGNLGGVGVDQSGVNQGDTLI